MGLAVAPTIAYYAATDPQAVWQAGGCTALFIAGLWRRRLRDAPRPLGTRARLLSGRCSR